MRHRKFGRTDFITTDIGFGAWQIGGAWGDVSEADGRAALHAALDAGMTFIDTADVYGDGRSEKIIADVLKERGGDRPMVATKAGRRLSPHVADGYNKANLEDFIDRSLKNLGVEYLDLVQLHCPPTEVYYRPEVFQALEEIKAAGKIADYGVSVEKVEEALKAIAALLPGSRPPQGRDYRPRAAGKRPALRQDHAGHRLCRRRPSQLQPPGRSLRRGRNLCRRALRDGP
jgi:aryl-alcohol dehydrogenase-like predicted oxidoreductase